MKNKKILFLFVLIGIILFVSSFLNARAQDVCVDETNGTSCYDDETGVDGTCQNEVCTSSASTSSTGSTATITFPNPLKYDTVEEVLTSLLNALQGVIVVISIVFIVIGAVFYITSGGSQKRIETAKKAIFASLIGLAIGIAAPTFLKEISNILGWTTDNEMVSEAPTIATIALNTLNFLLSIVGTISLIMLIVAAIMYLTAAGDEDRIDKGKKLFKYALIGITIALASLVIVKQIAGFFGG